MTHPLDHLAKTSCGAWNGLRFSTRHRIALAVAHLLKTGTLGRADIMALGEVSAGQAANDLREIRLRLPELMTYDQSAKCYRLAEQVTQ